jgi:very-short-patch-repair endonuclease
MARSSRESTACRFLRSTSEAEIYTDHHRDLELRAARYVVLRYTERQLEETPAAVAADIRGYL